MLRTKASISCVTFLVFLSCVLVLMPSTGLSQLAKGKSKFLGNAVSNGLLWPNYSTYWNQVTAGNAGK